MKSISNDQIRNQIASTFGAGTTFQKSDESELEKGGEGSGRHSKGTKVKYKSKEEVGAAVHRKGTFTVHKFLSADDPNKVGYELRDENGDMHKAQHKNLIKV